MDELKANIDQLKEKLNNIIDYTEKLDVDEFESDYKELVEESKSINHIRENLLKKYPREDLIPYNIEIDILIKQIRENFDNIVQAKKSIQAELKKELNQLINKRKLANYQR